MLLSLSNEPEPPHGPLPLASAKPPAQPGSDGVSVHRDGRDGALRRPRPRSSGRNECPSERIIGRSCAAARGADIAARCPYHAHIPDGRGRIVLSRSAYPTALEAARDGSGCSLSRRTGEGQGEGGFVRNALPVRQLFLHKPLVPHFINTTTFAAREFLAQTRRERRAYPSGV